jgi:hypothetical protein
MYGMESSVRDLYRAAQLGDTNISAVLFIMHPLPSVLIVPKKLKIVLQTVKVVAGALNLNSLATLIRLF